MTLTSKTREPYQNDTLLETFARDGVVVARGLLNSAEIDALRDAVDAQVAGVGTTGTGYDFEAIAEATWNDTPLETGAASRFNMDNLRNVIRSDAAARPLLDDVGSASSPENGNKGAFIYDVAAWQHHAGVRAVALRSALPEYCAKLLGARYLNFWEDTTFVKMPRTRQRTAFHQDLGYFQISGDQCVIVWIPLDPADNSNGVTEYVRGSHLWPETFASNTFIAQSPLPSSPGPRLPDIEGNRSDYDIVSYDVVPGDVVICHVRTVHGAGGNPSNRPRRAMSFRYCGDQVRYDDREGALRQVGVEHDLRTGDRLFSEDYPIAWPAELRGLPIAALPKAVSGLLASATA